MTTTARNRGIARALSLSTSREALITLAVLLAQVIAIIAYIGMTDTQVLSVQATLYPVVWITLSVYFVLFLWRYGPTVRDSQTALIAGGGYFLVLAVIAGLLWPAHELLGHHHHQTAGATLLWSSPGWGPVFLYSNSFVQIALVPFKLIAYGALAYGIAAAVAASSRGALAGIFGVFTCVGCIIPLLAIASGVFGSAGTIISTLGGSYELGTAVFALTITILLVAIPTSDPLADG